MKKIVVLSIVGVLLGMSGAIGMVVVREKQARAAASPPAGDSTEVHADSAGLASAAGDSAVADSLAGHLAQSDSAARDSASAAEPVAAGDDLDSATERADSLRDEVLATSAVGPDEERLARIFAAMRPEEAARVLEQMTDPEVRLLLSQLRERQAAAIMSNISPERAAVISSAVISGGRSTP